MIELCKIDQIFAYQKQKNELLGILDSSKPYKVATWYSPLKTIVEILKLHIYGCVE